jgi:hypothetical protein
MGKGMKRRLEQSTLEPSKAMLLDESRRSCDHQPVSDRELVTRINQAIARNGLQLQSTRRESISDDGRTGYEFVYRERSFKLRIGIEDLARALGILSAPAELHRRVRTRPCVCELR